MAALDTAGVDEAEASISDEVDEEVARSFGDLDDDWYEDNF